MGEVIGTLGQFLPPELAQAALRPFTKCARFYDAMDHILYLEEDVAYRADRVDPFLTLLWHPHYERAVGVKLKGFRFLFERLNEILRARGVGISDEGFPSLVLALEVAMTAGGGAALMAGAQRDRLNERYRVARELVRTVRFDPSELSQAA
jgi:hypothetical protein